MNNVVEICIAIDIAIFGLAYPILIDKNSRIGQNFKSEYLSNVFEDEWPNNKIIKNTSHFQTILIVTILSFIFKIFSFEPIHYFKDNIFVENSADILIFLLTIYLNIAFFYWINKIILFQSKASIVLNYLIKKFDDDKIESKQKRNLLKTINEFSIFAIKNEDPHIQKSLLEFYYKQFQKAKTDADPSEGPIYLDDLYFISNEIIETSIACKNNKLKALEHRASSGIWFFGENHKFNKISERTYKALWRNLYSAHEYKFLIANYWSTASQYFQYSLSTLYKDYNQADADSTAEKLEQIERERFLQINYALGGLLYYSNQYKNLKYILSYTQSSPATYPLLPSTMDEVFFWFEEFSNEFNLRSEQLEYKYPFPEVDNVGINGTISHNICLYISLLFVRMGTLQRFFTFQNFSKFHNIFNDSDKLERYSRMKPYFEKCINTVLSNTQLLEELQYNINKENVKNNFQNLYIEIDNSITTNKFKSILSPEKIRRFKKTTKENIQEAFNLYQGIINQNNFNNVDETISTSVIGEVMLSSKSSFTDNIVEHLNFDSIYSEDIVNNKIKRYIPNSFRLARNERFLIERKDLKSSLDKIISHNHEVIIVAINPKGESLKIINQTKYQSNLEVIPSTDTRLSDTFFILHRNDLPKFEFKKLSIDNVEKFNLEILDDKYSIYANVIDVNLPKNKPLKEEYITKNDEELKVLVVISFKLLIKWRKDRNIIMLSLASPYEERGIVNNINDLTQL